MSRHFVLIVNDRLRERAAEYVQKAPWGSRVEFKGPQRTTEQNAVMWVMLSDIARQIKWHGITLPADDWKLIFLDALKGELRMVPNLDGTGFVNLGRSSSDLSHGEMHDLLTLITAWGDQNGVVFSEPKKKQSQPEPEAVP